MYPSAIERGALAARGRRAFASADRGSSCMRVSGTFNCCEISTTLTLGACQAPGRWDLRH